MENELLTEIANGITGFGCGITANWDGCGECEGLKENETCKGAVELAAQIRAKIREMLEGSELTREETWEIYQANGGRGVAPRDQVNSVAEAQLQASLKALGE